MQSQIGKIPRRQVLVGAALALVGGAVAALLLAMQPPSLPHARLSDGSEVTLVAMLQPGESGTVGGPLQCLLARLLPRIPANKLGVQVYPNRQRNGMTAWVRRVGPSYPQLDFRAAVIDERGGESPVQYAMEQGGLNLFRYEAYPRRGRVIGLRFYRWVKAAAKPGTQRTWQFLGEVLAPNHRVSELPRWPASTFPSRGRAAGLEASVSALRIVGPAKPSWRESGPADVTYRANLSLTYAGKPANGWTAWLTQITDASGNVWEPNSHDSPLPGGKVRLEFVSCPWPDEDVWNLTLRVSPTDRTPVSPGDAGWFRNLPVPRRNETIPLHRSMKIRGVSVDLAEISGPETTGFTFPGLGWQPSARLALSQRGGDSALCGPLRAVDQRGRPVRVMPIRVEAGTVDKSVFFVPIQARPGAKSIDFAYGVRSTHVINLRVPHAVSPARK